MTLGHRSWDVADKFQAHLPRIARHLKRIEQRGERLVRIPCDLLDLAKFESGKMDYEMGSKELARLTADVAAELSMMANDKGLTLSSAPPRCSASTWTDAVRLG